MKRASGPRPAPIFPAFVRPPTVFGCDPRVFAVVATLSAMLVLPAGVMRLNPFMVALGLTFFAGSVVQANRASKNDPQWLDVWWRSRRYSRRYDARARWDKRAPRQGSWS